ncbi:MAG: NUDIX domain-containing protein [Candidatus Pacebacteria bacterium]|nr:NUDIX domain-containing protein [Candidatus Paceibacterota bacterium]
MITERRSYGVIPVHNGKFLLLKQNKGHWGFPKGHKEGNETDEECALRELKEESGIANCVLSDFPPISEDYYLVDEGKPDWHKVVKFFIGFIESDEVTIQREEIMDYKWATYEEALETLTYENNKKVLKEAAKFL